MLDWYTPLKRVFYVPGSYAVGLSLFFACTPQEAPLANSTGASTRPSHAQEPPAGNHDSAVALKHIKAHGQLGPGRGTLIVDIRAPAGAKLSEGAPLTVHAQGKDLGFPKRLRTPLALAQLPLRLPIDVADGALGPAEMELSYYFCETGERASCRPERTKLSIALDLSGSTPGGEAHFTHQPVL